MTIIKPSNTLVNSLKAGSQQLHRPTQRIKMTTSQPGQIRLLRSYPAPASDSHLNQGLYLAGTTN
jgi:hypothetical protein